MSEVENTPGPWAWFGSTKSSMYLATTHSGRRYVMGFKRKGMDGAEPTFQIKQRMVPASELAIYEVNRAATSAKDRSVYRHDIVGFRSADARLIAAAPTLLEALREAKVQVEILQERLGIKDTGAGTLSIINTALASVEPHTEGVGA